MIGIKGDLRRSNSDIIKIRIRDNKGIIKHRAEFRISDTNSMVRELRLLEDKFGVNCFSIRDSFRGIINEDIKRELSEEEKNLKNWRERTKNLREPDKELQEKLRNL